MFPCKLGLTSLNDSGKSTFSFLCISYKCLHDFIVSPVFSPLLTFSLSRICLSERPFQ